MVNAGGREPLRFGDTDAEQAGPPVGSEKTPKPGIGAKLNRRWLTRGFWAGLDRGLFAISSFAINLLLARWLTPHEYGAFVLVFSVSVFFGVLQAAVLLEPMLVFGPGRYKDRMQEYLGALVYGQIAFVALVSLAELLVALVLVMRGADTSAAIVLALAFAAPWIQLQNLLRRACYARLGPRLAASGGAWYMVLMLLGAYALYRGGLLSGASAYVVIGLSSLVVSVWLALRLRIEFPPLRGELVRDAFRRHLGYGRWAVVNQGLSWLPQYFVYLILPIWGGLAAVASFRALMNVVSPVLQFSWALSNLVLPAFVRARAKGQAALDSRVRTSLMLFTVGPTFCWLIMGLLHQPLVSLLYGGRYTEHAGLLWLLGLSPILLGVKMVLGYAVKSYERPDWLVSAYAIPAVVALILEAVFVYFWGLTGAAWGMLLAQAFTVVVVIAFYRRLPLKARDSLQEGHEAGETVQTT